MDEFLEDLKSGEIQFRDRWQFELKSEFSPKIKHLESSYTQEFYFFIPNSLQITPETYSKEDFYRDLTNLIRYKTPLIQFRDLCDEHHRYSPLHQLHLLLKDFSDENSGKQVQNELKLLGNGFRSSLRREIQKILNFPEPPVKEVQELIFDIKKFRTNFKKLSDDYSVANSRAVTVTFGYLDEFIGNSIDYYLTGLLDQFQMHHSPVPKTVETILCDMIIDETEHREKSHLALIQFSPDSSRNEQILYRLGLLKKYFMDALALHVDRTSTKERYGTLISGFSAGVAMLMYVLLFIWQGYWFVINSVPFILITVGAYILRDTLKDSLKSISYQRALSYFSDYKTNIKSPQDEVIGELKESFSFVDEAHIPEDIRRVRNHEFHAMLKTFKRPEQVIYFKRIIKMYSPENKKNVRLKSLNIALRYNVQDFLEKASDPYHSYTTLDVKTKTLLKLRLPKVYHLNIILKNRYTDDNEIEVTELNKFRLILDKNGIKNIEQVINL